MADLEERQQQALDYLHLAVKRLIQEGMKVEIIDHVDQHQIDVILYGVDWIDSNRTLKLAEQE